MVINACFWNQVAATETLYVYADIRLFHMVLRGEPGTKIIFIK